MCYIYISLSLSRLGKGIPPTLPPAAPAMGARPP